MSFLPPPPPHERRSRVQAAAIRLGRYGACARCRHAVPCLPSTLLRKRGSPVWTSPGVSSLCLDAVCMTVRAATQGNMLVLCQFLILGYQCTKTLVLLDGIAMATLIFKLDRALSRSDIITLNAYAIGCARQISDVPPPTSVLSRCAVRGRRRPRSRHQYRPHVPATRVLFGRDPCGRGGPPSPVSL